MALAFYRPQEEIEEAINALIREHAEQWQKNEDAWFRENAVPENLRPYVREDKTSYSRGFQPVSMWLSNSDQSDNPILFATDADGMISDDKLRNSIAGLNGFHVLEIGSQEMTELQLPPGFKSNLGVSFSPDLERLALPAGYKGNIHLIIMDNLRALELPVGHQGNIYLYNLPNLQALQLPTGSSGNVHLDQAENLQTLEVPENHKGDLTLYGLRNLQTLQLSKGHQGNLTLHMALALQTLELPEGYQGNLDLQDILNLQALPFPTGYRGNVKLIGSRNNLRALEFPEGYKGNLELGILDELRTLKLPESFEGDLIISHAENLENITLPKNYKGRLVIERLDNLQFIQIGDERIETMQGGERRQRKDVIADVIKRAEEGKIAGVEIFHFEGLKITAEEMQAAKERGIAARAGVADGITSGNAAGTSLKPEPPTRWVERAGEKLDPANHRNTRKSNKGKNLQERDFGPAG